MDIKETSGFGVILMIESMIKKVNKYLPLKIESANWDGAVFQIYGQGWNFNTLSAWRIISENKVLLGYYDDDAEKIVGSLVNNEIIKIEVQESILKVDPIFVLSNGKKIEIFSTDTFEPWTFFIEEIGMYIAAPSEPSAFDPNCREDDSE